MSATCPPHVQDDIIQVLEKPDMKKHIYPMDRTNITFSVEHVTSNNEKMDYIHSLLHTYKVPTLIYFNNRKAAEECVSKLIDKLPGRRIAFYHGGMEQMDRIIVQQQFMNNQLDVICCTNAFGMGINKSDIRLIIHYHFPLQIESFIQEVGRAGRDGKQSMSLLLYSPKDVAIPKSLIQSELPTDGQINAVFHYLLKTWKTDQSIPWDDSHLINLFQMNETQWRFLYYQLEKNDMIKGKRIVYDEYNWKQAFLSIQAKRDERLQYKENKLYDMMKWLHQESCLRKHLYKDFQAGYSQPIGPCCSNCEFSWSEWKPEEINRFNETNKTWQNKLKDILFIGETT